MAAALPAYPSYLEKYLLGQQEDGLASLVIDCLRLISHYKGRGRQLQHMLGDAQRSIPFSGPLQKNSLLTRALGY